MKLEHIKVHADRKSILKWSYVLTLHVILLVLIITSINSSGTVNDGQAQAIAKGYALDTCLNREINPTNCKGLSVSQTASRYADSTGRVQAGYYFEAGTNAFRMTVVLDTNGSVVRPTPMPIGD